MMKRALILIVISLLLSLTPSSAQMVPGISNPMMMGISYPIPTVTFLANPTFTSGTANPALSVNVGNPGKDRIIVVMPWADQIAGTTTITSVTVGGTSLTQRASSRFNGGGGTIELWSGVVPAATIGAQTVTVVYNRTMARGQFMVYQITDYFKDAPVAVASASNITTAAGSILIGTAPQGVVIVGHTGANNYGSVTWTGPVENCDGPVLAGAQGGGCASANGTTGADYPAIATMQATPSVGAGMVGAAFR